MRFPTLAESIASGRAILAVDAFDGMAVAGGTTVQNLKVEGTTVFFDLALSDGLVVGQVSGPRGTTLISLP